MLILAYRERTHNAGGKEEGDTDLGLEDLVRLLQPLELGEDGGQEGGGGIGSWRVHN